MLSNPHQYLNCARQFIAGKFLPCIFTLTVFFIYWSVPLFAAESEGGGSQLLDFIWKVVNVTVLLAIIYKFAKKPLANALNNSASTAKKVIDDAREAEENISAELNEMRSKIAGLEEEAVQMVNSAKKEAELEKERIIEEGRQEIERMKKQASFALDQERRKAEDDLRHWIAEESVNLAENKLKQEMDQNQQNKLVTKYMDQLSRTKGAA
ncbi:MAG: ATP synthase subunit b [Deltaproteobacteria bacterium]|jgi:F-type H+-transporting ATPase subunit b|nr:ATP synthase subunit b [Deltaproteobacteria bacterium]